MERFIRCYTSNYYRLYSQKDTGGHGIQGQLKQVEEDTGLLIISDSSTNSVDACRTISEEMGIDIVILDHHMIEVENPYATIVNPKQAGCPYPNKDLSAVGVVFKAIEVMQDELNEAYDNTFDVWNHTDMVAVGLRADEMDMSVPENRYLVLNGLENIKTVGIERILKGGKIYNFEGLNSDTISFTIAPMINGAIRMGQIELPIELMLTDDDKIAKKLRLKMQKLNDQRKQAQREAVDEYSIDIDLNQKIIMVIDNESNSGFNGIVAQQLSSKYNRPALVMKRNSKGFISGSGRSYNNFKMLSFLNEIEGVTAMGHEGAMGVQFHEDDLEYVKAYIDLNMDELEDIEVTQYYDLELDAEEVSMAIEAIEQFNRVWGTNSKKFTVRVTGVMIEETSLMGKEKNHMKIKAMTEQLEFVKFFIEEGFGEDLTMFAEAEFIGAISQNKFFNFKTRQMTITNQMIIDDYKLTV